MIFKNRLKLCRYLAGSKGVILLLACLAPALNMTGQPGALRWLQLNSHICVPHNNDFEEVHNYCTEVIPNNVIGANNDQSVMAGNVFHKANLPAWHAAHFLKFDVDLTPLTQSYFYDLDYPIARTQDIALDGSSGNSQSFITMWVRAAAGPYLLPDNTTHFPGALFTDRDGIKILRVDNNTGSLVPGGELSLFENSPLPDGWTYGNSLFPISSMYYSGYLYICGFYTRFGTPDGVLYTGSIPSNGHMPLTSTTEKSAFILRVDVSGGSMAFDNIMVFDYVPATNLTGVDYDMAMRMKPLMDGNIMITGSVNGQNGPYNPGYVRSATMAVVVDPTLNSMIASPNFMEIGNMDGFGDNEYGVDIVQQTLNDIYIMSNGYAMFSDEGGYGFNPQPYKLIVSKVRSLAGGYTFIPNRFQSYAQHRWFLNAIPGENPYSGGHRFTVAGLAASGCSDQDYPTSFSNINPILVDFEVPLNFQSIYNPSNNDPSAPKAGFAQISLFENSNGTSNYSTYENTALSGMYINPTFAAREDNNSAVVLNTPWFDAAWNVLGIKTMHVVYNAPPATAQTTDVYTGGHDNRPPDVECGNATCAIEFGANQPTPNSIGVTFRNVNIFGYNPGVTEASNLFAVDMGHYCNVDFPSSYKTAGVPLPLHRTGKTTIYPNPAIAELYISLSNNITHDANVQVHLMNLVGQSVGLLYKGSAGNINDKALQLPDVAPGMYMVQVMSNNKIVHREKLVIK